jgi:PEP-CTERM motif
MTIFSKLRIACAILFVAAATSKTQAQSITTTQSLGTYHDTWSSIGGPASSFSQDFSYQLFDSSLGTLESVQFCIALKGYGEWMADYGGGDGIKYLDITMTGGQAINVDGGLGWLGAGWVPVINDFNVTGTISLDNVAVPFWIMSPQDGPGFSWGALQGFNLPNTSAFIGAGTDSATFSSYGLLSYLTNPNVSIALDGHDFNWKADLSLKYTYAPVPEPSSAILLGSTFLLGFGFRRRRKAA